MNPVSSVCSSSLGIDDFRKICQDLVERATMYDVDAMDARGGLDEWNSATRAQDEISVAAVDDNAERRQKVKA